MFFHSGININIYALVNCEYVSAINAIQKMDQGLDRSSYLLDFLGG